MTGHGVKQRATPPVLGTKIGHALDTLEKKKKRASSLLLIDAEDRVVADVLCLKCATNLNNLHIHDRCANCGHPVSDSVHGDYLIHTDKNVVRNLADAARTVEWGVLALCGLVLLGMLFSMLKGLRHLEIRLIVEGAYRMVFAGAVISPVVAAVGFVLLTTRGTAAYFWARHGNQRTFLRVGLVAALILAAVTFSVAYFGQVAAEITVVLWFAFPVGGFLRGVERLMRRVPNKQLASFARATFVGLIAFAALSILIIIVRRLALQDVTWSDSATALTAVNLFAGAVVGVAGYTLIVRVHRTLRAISH